jgi:hypothetical protein
MRDMITDENKFPKIVKLWNEHCGEMKQVKICTTSRIRIAEQALRNNSDIDFWINLFKKAAENFFLCGGGNIGWRASFDWIMNEDNIAKVLEDYYQQHDNSKKKNDDRQKLLRLLKD